MARLPNQKSEICHLASASIAALCLVVALAIRETRPPGAPPPLSRGSFFSRRAVAPSGVMLGLCYSYGTIISFLPIYALKHGDGNPGFFFTAFALTLIVVRAFGGRAADRYGRSAVILLGLAFVAFAMGCLALGASRAGVLAAAILYGVGYGLAQPALMALTADRVGAEERGRAMATLFTALEIGIGAGSVLAGIILGASGFPAMFATAGAGALCGMLGQLVLARAERRARRPAPAGSVSTA